MKLAQLVTIGALTAASWAGSLNAQSVAVAVTNVMLMDGTGAPPGPP